MNPMNPMNPTRPKTQMPEQGQGVILIVDDDPDSLSMLCDALSTDGYQVLAARGADEAMARLEMITPDAVLLDAVMPGKNGFDLCRDIKQEAAWNHLPVIFMTGLAETEQIVNGFACGGVDYVVKPLKIPEVLARLRVHLRNASASRLAREAVDVAGMGIVLLDRFGRIAWRSPQALRLLEQAFEDEHDPQVMLDWLTQALREDRVWRELRDGTAISAGRVGQAGLGENMLLLARAPAGTRKARHVPDVPLTPRETEVLSWLAKGKTNRDIGEILGMSPRTVNKHLEHIFEKLGVETRTAAAALANRMQSALEAGERGSSLSLND